MTVTITCSSRPSWAQQATGDIWSPAVAVRVERIAAAETIRLGPGRHIEVSARDDAGECLAVVWPALGLSYWVYDLRGEAERATADAAEPIHVGVTAEDATAGVESGPAVVDDQEP